MLSYLHTAEHSGWSDQMPNFRTTFTHTCNGVHAFEIDICIVAEADHDPIDGAVVWIADILIEDWQTKKMISVRPSDHADALSWALYNAIEAAFRDDEKLFEAVYPDAGSAPLYHPERLDARSQGVGRFA